jgi:hypothetical protein
MAVLADITQITAANGYSSGGSATSITSCTQTNGVLLWVLGDVTFTATGGAMATFRYAVLYNDTASGDPLISWYDNGSAVSLASGDAWVWDADPTAGALQAS